MTNQVVIGGGLRLDALDDGGLLRLTHA